MKKDFIFKRRNISKHGLNDIIKPYASTAPNFINLILSHQYKTDFLAPE